jgi:class 3 adenylate cyclase
MVYKSLRARLVVVVGEVVEHDVAGHTPNLAARLQPFAKPDAVVVATSTPAG